MGLLLGMSCCPYRNSTFFPSLVRDSESRLSILGGLSTLVEFIDWVRCK